jgi:monoamine oxidase
VAGWRPSTTRSFALAREVGVSTYKTYVAGDHLLLGEGRMRRYRGLIPKISPAAILTLFLANARLDRMAKRLPVDAPWTAKRAAEWDALSVGLVSRAVGHSDDPSRATCSSRRCGVCSPATCTGVSLLNMLFLIRAHGSINTLFSISGGSQENLVVGGAGAIAHRVADDLGGAIRLNTPVRAIRAEGRSRRRRERRAHRVGAPRDRHRSLRVALEIEFDPRAAADRRDVVPSLDGGSRRRRPCSSTTSRSGVRTAFSGQSADPKSASEVTIDATPACRRSPGCSRRSPSDPSPSASTRLDAAERPSSRPRGHG